jgi:hypothetical protein
VADSDEGSRAFAEAEKFCQEGKNKGKPGPCPDDAKQAPQSRKPSKPTKGKAPAAKKPTATAKGTAAILFNGLKNAQGLSEEKKNEYIGAVNRVTANMPPKVHALLQQRIKNVNFYASSAELTAGLKKSGVRVPKGVQPAGCWTDKSQQVFIDGAVVGKFGGVTAKHPPEHIYAHELGHAIDHNGELSNSKAWQDAWKAEIDQDAGPLSGYAKVDPAEGFAEFSRALYSGHFHPADVFAQFPKASKFFLDQGLWPPRKRR